MNVEVRSVPIVGTDEDKREIVGIAVPWDEVTTRIGYPEMFQRGSIPDGAEATLHVNHAGTRGELPVGKVTGTDTDRGYRITATVARTPRGDEALQLAREGVLKHFSIGFVPIETEMRGDTVVRIKTDMREVSLVERPAYTGAVIEQVRSAATTPEQETTMPEDDLTQLRAEQDARFTEIERRIGVLGDGLTGRGAPTFKVRSGGEFLKALARGDADAIAEYRGAAEQLETRAYTGPTTSDTVMQPAWIDKMLRLTDERRPMTNLFSREPLPATGNSFEYPVVTTETGTVQQQVNEGDDLAFLEVALGTRSATVRTVGGYTSLTRQLIERSTVAYLDTALRYLGIQYADAFEKYVRDFYTALPVADVDPAKNVNEVDTTTKPSTAAGWIGAIYDAAAEIEDNSKGLLADFVVVSRDIAKEISLLADTAGRPLFALNGDGQNTWGSLAVRAQDIVGSINSLPVVVVPKLAAGSVAVCSKAAITTLESAGAPVRLEDENIINLTKDFSLYGYQAIYSEQPKGITKITWTP